MHETLEFLIRHGAWVLFTWVLAEQLGAPFPSLPILLAMGALIGFGDASFARAMTVVLAASLIADFFWYSLGRRRGYSILRLLCRISIEPDSCVSSTQDWFRRMGAWSLVVAKFVPGFGAIAAPMAGLSRIPRLEFLAADALGVVLWSGTYLAAGDLFREQLEDAGAFIARLGGGLFALLIFLGALWIGWKFWNRQRFLRRLRVARVEPQEVVHHLEDFVILDLRSSTEVQHEGVRVPGAIWFDRHELARRHDEIPRDRDIVLYCT